MLVESGKIRERMNALVDQVVKDLDNDNCDRCKAEIEPFALELMMLSPDKVSEAERVKGQIYRIVSRYAEEYRSKEQYVIDCTKSMAERIRTDPSVGLQQALDKWTAQLYAVTLANSVPQKDSVWLQ